MRDLFLFLLLLCGLAIGCHTQSCNDGRMGPRGVTGAQGPQGITGARGLNGSDGIAGMVGPPGVTGPAGEQGIQGIQGEPGEIGPPGLNGTEGAPGVQGDQGPPGEQGAQGTQGIPGVTGAQGPQGPGAGATGATGAQGPTGVTGVTGNIGVTGAIGLQGVTGAIGPTGVTGTQGVTGMQGVTGAVGIQGVTGIQGTTGIQGLQGVTGYTGAQGVTGAQGTTGVTGITGAQGIQGVQGVTGAQGATGIQGYTGITGAQGIQGLQGVTGVTGAIGAQGVTGIQGVTGAQGITGVQGIQGTTGVTGAIGTQGVTGIQGVTGVTGSIGTGVTGPTGPRGATGASGGGGGGGSMLLYAQFTAIMPSNNSVLIATGEAVSFPVKGPYGPPGVALPISASSETTFVLPEAGTYAISWNVPFQAIHLGAGMQFAVISAYDVVGLTPGSDVLNVEGNVAAYSSISSGVVLSGGYSSYELTGIQARIAQNIARYTYSYLALLPATGTLSSSESDSTFSPGVYQAASSSSFTGGLTLNGNGLYVFRATQFFLDTPTIARSGVNPANIFWIATNGQISVNNDMVGTGIATAGIDISTSTGVWIGNAWCIEGRVTFVDHSGRNNYIFALGRPDQGGILSELPYGPVAGQVGIQVDDGGTGYVLKSTVGFNATGGIVNAADTVYVTTLNANATVQLVCPVESLFPIYVATDQTGSPTPINAHITFRQLS